MLRRHMIWLVALQLALGTAAIAQIPNRSESGNAPRSDYAPVNGLRMYYEVHGSGKPLILLHGGIAASEVFGASIGELAKGRQVIAPHMQAHGRTRDIDRPLRYEHMADDVAALIARLGLENVDVLGYSMGGGVALQLAIRHPRLVDRLVVVSEPMKRSGWYPEILAVLDQMSANAAQSAEVMKQSPLTKLYPEVDWKALFTKTGEMEAQHYDWSDKIAAIKSPTMLVFADADAIRPEHMVEFYKLLGGGHRDAGFDGSLRPTARLAIVPGTTHYNIFATTTVAKLVADFLGSSARRPR